MSVSRRYALLSLGGGALALGGAWWATRPSRTASVAKSAPLAPVQVAEALARASEAETLALTEGWLARGATPEDLLRAAYLARPLLRTDQGDVHSMLVIPSIARLAAPFDTPEALAAVFWAVANTAGWMLSPEPPRSPPAPASGLDRRLVSASLAYPNPHVAILTARSLELAAALEPEHRALLLSRLESALSPPGPDEAVAGAEPGASRPDPWAELAVEAAERILVDPTPTGQAVHSLTLVEARYALARAYPDLSRPLWRATAEHLALLRPEGAVLAAVAGQAPPLETVSRDLRAAALAHGAESHAFKHPDALIRLAGWLPPAARDRVLAVAGSAPVLSARSDWPLREEALARSRRLLER